MKLRDTLRMALGNLRRSKLRNLLTFFGIVIGIGAMVSLLSFGTGLKKVALREAEGTIFTTITVQPKNRDSSPLTDETVQKFRALTGVRIAYPMVAFPVMTRIGDKKASAIVRGLPAEIGKLKPYSDQKIGRFFTSDDAYQAIVSQKLLDALKLKRDEVINKEITITALVSQKGGTMPVTREEKFKVIGIIESMESLFFGTFLFLPIDTAKNMGKGVFKDLEQILDMSGTSKGYSTVHIRAATANEVEKICKEIEKMGYKTWSLQEQFKEIRTFFLLFNSVLGGIGAIGLLIACLGIANTMITSVLERTKEIGIMKAVGAGNKDIRNLYFAQTGIIGFCGGVFGVVLGWAVTRIAEPIMNFYMVKYGEKAIDLFCMPVWLIAGAIAFAVFASLLAGLYPARRAIRISPARTLRYE